MNRPPEIRQSDREAIRSIRVSRVILPIILGIIVVAFLFWQQFDYEEFKKIEWQSAAWLWLALAIILLSIRHLSYAARLHILSEGAFSWKKCIELIFIWEFSSAVSPTSVGGSAVALFVLSQERLSTAKTTTIVLYTIVLDTLFFISSIPVLYLMLGPIIIRPGMSSLGQADGWALTFLFAYVFMALYGIFFFYGLFIKPQHGQRLLHWIGSWHILRRWKDKIEGLGDGFVQASKEIWGREISFHLKAFGTTAIAWSLRFLLINCLILAIVPGVSELLMDQFKIYARLETMFVILAFSPTPGGAGFHEYVFGGFLSDYVPVGIALLVALVWRLLTYYSYLIAGVIVIPNWLRNIITERRKERKASDAISE
jgi:uncharacterized protein (TIRG00374 family)